MQSVQKNYIPLLTKNADNLLCPLCNIPGKLEITFYQLQAEADGNITNTKQITASAFCSSCRQDIPNVRWTHELHNFYKTEKKQIKVKFSFKTTRRLRIVLRVLLGFVLFIVGLSLFSLIIRFIKQH